MILNKQHRELMDDNAAIAPACDRNYDVSWWHDLLLVGGDLKAKPNVTLDSSMEIFLLWPEKPFFCLPPFNHFLTHSKHIYLAFHVKQCRCGWNEHEKKAQQFRILFVPSPKLLEFLVINDDKDEKLFSSKQFREFMCFLRFPPFFAVKSAVKQWNSRAERLKRLC